MWGLERLPATAQLGFQRDDHSSKWRSMKIMTLKKEITRDMEKRFVLTDCPLMAPTIARAHLNICQPYCCSFYLNGLSPIFRAFHNSWRSALCRGTRKVPVRGWDWTEVCSVEGEDNLSELSQLGMVKGAKGRTVAPKTFNYSEGVDKGPNREEGPSQRYDEPARLPQICQRAGLQVNRASNGVKLCGNVCKTRRRRFDISLIPCSSTKARKKCLQSTILLKGGNSNRHTSRLRVSRQRFVPNMN